MAYQSGTATDYKDLLDQLVEIVTSDYVTSVAINAGGTGYVVGDILTVAGGTSTHTATLRVTSVSSGVIDGVQVEEAGAYTVDPTTTANAVTGGTGSGATMDLTMQTAEWTEERNQAHSTIEQEVILRGRWFWIGQHLCWNPNVSRRWCQCLQLGACGIHWLQRCLDLGEPSRNLPRSIR